VGIDFHVLLGQPDNVHRAGIAPGAKAGGYVLFLAELQAGGLVIMERAMGFALLVYLYAQAVGHFQYGELLFQVLDFHQLRGLMISSFCLTVISIWSPMPNPACSNHIPLTFNQGTCLSPMQLL
jgi:hypothetical protein